LVILQSEEEELEEDETDDWKCFNEEKYIKENPDEFNDKRKKILRKIPEVKEVIEFIKAI